MPRPWPEDIWPPRPTAIGLRQTTPRRNGLLLSGRTTRRGLSLSSGKAFGQPAGATNVIRRCVAENSTPLRKRTARPRVRAAYAATPPRTARQTRSRMGAGRAAAGRHSEPQSTTPASPPRRSRRESVRRPRDNSEWSRAGCLYLEEDCSSYAISPLEPQPSQQPAHAERTKNLSNREGEREVGENDIPPPKPRQRQQ